MARSGNYTKIIEWIFLKRYRLGDTSVSFDRSDIDEATEVLGLPKVKNLGDVIYAFRYRKALPAAITNLASGNKEWIIRGDGRAKYRFDLVDMVRIRPNEALITTKIPDATPEIINATALADEQALLALVRYNRLIDIFLGVTAYSLQNHLRTTASGVGQVEIDEIYVALDQHGQEYIIPVQAKGHGDELGVTQPEQDLAVCKEKWPQLVPLPVAVQFMEDGTIAMFLLTLKDDQISVLKEAHYQLVPYSDIDEDDRRIKRLISTADRNDTLRVNYALVEIEQQ